MFDSGNKLKLYMILLTVLIVGSLTLAVVALGVSVLLILPIVLLYAVVMTGLILYERRIVDLTAPMRLSGAPLMLLMGVLLAGFYSMGSVGLMLVPGLSKTPVIRVAVLSEIGMIIGLFLLSLSLYLVFLLAMRRAAGVFWLRVHVVLSGVFVLLQTAIRFMPVADMVPGKYAALLIIMGIIYTVFILLVLEYLRTSRRVRSTWVR